MIDFGRFLEWNEWSKIPVEKLLPSVRNIKVPGNCQNIKSLLGKFNILWPNATK